MMKSMKVALAMLGVAALLTVVPATASNASVVVGGGGGDGGGSTNPPTVYDFSLAITNGTLGSVSAQETTPNSTALTSGGTVDAGATFTVTAPPTAGNSVLINASGGACGPESILSSDSAQFGPVAGNCTVNVTFSSGTPAPPTVGDVTATVVENSTANNISLDLGGGAADEVDVASGPSHGSTSASGTAISYTPAIGYTGLDSFTYTAKNDGGTSSSATVSITVNPPKPIAADSSASVAENSSSNAITLSLSGGAATSLVLDTDVSHGNLLVVGTGVTYTPAIDFYGSDSFSYTAKNGGGTSATATVSITVNPPAPIAGDSNLTVDENSGATSVILNVSGGPVVNLSTVDAASHGTVSIAGSTMTYTPAHDYSGTDEFSYIASNGGGSSVNVGLVSVTVDAVYNTLSYSYADYDNVTTSIDGTPLATISATDTSTSTAVASGGSVREGDTATVTITPVAGYSLGTGAATGCAGGVSMGLSDFSLGAFAGDCDVRAFLVAASAPTVADATVTVAANSTANSIPLSIEGPAATGISVGTAPVHGTVSFSGATAVYTPVAGYSGTDTFTYTASNDSGSSSAATVTVTVTPPTVTASANTLDAGGTVGITGTNFASDESVTIILHSKPVTLGTFTADASGNLAVTITIPAGVSGGHHTLLVEGAVSGTTSIPITVHVTAVARVLGFTGGLTSGGILTELFLAVLFAGLGGYLVIVRRRRQRREL